MSRDEEIEKILKEHDEEYAQRLEKLIDDKLNKKTDWQDKVKGNFKSILLSLAAKAIWTTILMYGPILLNWLATLEEKKPMLKLTESTEKESEILRAIHLKAEEFIREIEKVEGKLSPGDKQKLIEDFINTINDLRDETRYFIEQHSK